IAFRRPMMPRVGSSAGDPDWSTARRGAANFCPSAQTDNGRPAGFFPTAKCQKHFFLTAKMPPQRSEIKDARCKSNWKNEKPMAAFRLVRRRGEPAAAHAHPHPPH